MEHYNQHAVCAPDVAHRPQLLADRLDCMEAALQDVQKQANDAGAKNAELRESLEAAEQEVSALTKELSEKAIGLTGLQDQAKAQDDQNGQVCVPSVGLPHHPQTLHMGRFLGSVPVKTKGSTSHNGRRLMHAYTCTSTAPWSLSLPCRE